MKSVGGKVRFLGAHKLIFQKKLFLAHIYFSRNKKIEKVSSWWIDVFPFPSLIYYEINPIFLIQFCSSCSFLVILLSSNSEDVLCFITFFSSCFFNYETWDDCSFFRTTFWKLARVDNASGLMDFHDISFVTNDPKWKGKIHK
jgi:hypothetical protein